MQYLNNHLEKGFHLLELGRIKEARELISEVLYEQHPVYGLALSLLGLTYAMEGDTTKATQYGKEGLAILPDEGFVHYVMGLISFAKKANKSTIFHLKNAIELDPENELYYIKLAQVYFFQEKYSKARKNIEAALSLKPNYVEALLTSSQIALHEKNPILAKELIAQALQTDPTNFKLLEAKAVQANKEGDYDTAQFLFEQLVIKYPDKVYYQNNFLDAVLGKHKLYEWLVLKPFRSRDSLPFTFKTDFLIIFLGFIPLGLLLNYSVWATTMKVILGLVASFRLLAWSTRFFAHTFLKRKLWKLRIKDFLTYPNFVSITIMAAYPAFLYHLYSWSPIGIGFAFFSMLFLLYGLFFMKEKDPTKKKLWKYYISGLYLIGLIILVLTALDHSNLKYFSFLLFLYIILPVFANKSNEG